MVEMITCILNSYSEFIWKQPVSISSQSYPLIINDDKASMKCWLCFKLNRVEIK